MLKTVFITKYCLTSTGVMVEEMAISDDGKSCFGKPKGWIMGTGFYGKDFHLTEEAALKDFHERKAKKIKALKKLIQLWIRFLRVV